MSVDSQVRDAHAAWLQIREWDSAKIVALLGSIADALDQAKADLVPVAMEETNLPEARLTGEVGRTTGQLRLMARAVEDRTYLDITIDHADSSLTPPRPDLRLKSTSLGVVGVFGASNFPFAFGVAGGDTAAALAAGCAVVIKVNPGHPRVSRMVGEIMIAAALKAGAPAGLISLVEDFDAGMALVEHPLTAAIAFTGSTEVGKKIARAIAATDKKATLELGGKGANIVFDDAPVDEAVEGVVNGIFFNQGHVCCAGSRLILQESIAEEIIEKLKVRMAKIRVGDPLDKNTDLGAINSREQLTKIQELAAIGDAEGAQRWSPQCNLSDKGYWFAPTIFTGVTQAHRIAQEEIFGPVLSVITFRTPQEGIDKANNTPFGLSAGIWSEKGSRTLWASQQLRAGVIWANTFNKFDPTSPFGGYKESGWGREGGKHGLAAYLKTGRESGGK